jgi:CheY-like chemotaxis protein
MRPIEALMVEDDPEDVELTIESMGRAKIVANITVVEDGEKAMDYLRRKGRYADAARPDVILLDLNLPRKDGRDVLKEIKADPALKSVPVVVLTTSRAEEDILRSYETGASCYVTKPLGLKQFAEMAEAIQNFWFAVVSYPPKG